MKPALLLDIDGVLAPFGESESYQWHPRISHFFSRSNTEHLRLLGETFELTWATAWEDEANRVWCDIHDLEPLEVIKFGTKQLHGRIYLPPEAKMGDFSSWKLPWIITWAEMRGGPLAWIDDDIRPDALDWADHRETPTFFVKTDPAKGLLPDHVELLLDWAETLETDA